MKIYNYVKTLSRKCTSSTHIVNQKQHQPTVKTIPAERSKSHIDKAKSCPYETEGDIVSIQQVNACRSGASQNVELMRILNENQFTEMAITNGSQNIELGITKDSQNIELGISNDSQIMELRIANENQNIELGITNDSHKIEFAISDENPNVKLGNSN